MRGPHLALAALALLTALVYLPGLDGPVLLDDRHHLAPLGRVADGSLTPWDYVLGPGTGRPIARATFLASWSISGDDIRGFKVGNLALHLLCGIAVFGLARALARAAALRNPDAIAVFVSGAWLLSPLLVSTVLYTVQRMAQLATLFSLLGLWCYVHARASGARWPLVAAAACWLLGTLSKENAAVLPLLALLVELWLFTARPAARAWRRALLALVGVAALALLVRIAADPAWLLAGYGARDFTLGERLLTQPRVLLDYLGNLLLVPGASPLGLFRDDVAPSRGLLDPPTTAGALLAWVGLGAFALWSRGTSLAAAGLGVAFFLAAHAVESGIFPLELYFEHRNYFPAFGALFALGACGSLLAARRPRAIGALALLAILVFAVLTAHRAWIWRGEASLYAHAAATHPGSARAWLGLASVHFNAGRFGPGRDALEHASRLLGERARLAIALQQLAAYCVPEIPVPEAAYAALERARAVGVDLHTINALAWATGGLPGCLGLDAARVARALERVERTPASWSRERERLRDMHLERLLHALETRPDAGR